MLAFSHMGAGFGPMIGILLGLGFWFQAEAIADALNWTGAVF